MSLVEDNHCSERNGADLLAALNRWRYCAPSQLLHHGKPCCSAAREWLFSTDHSQLNGQDKLMGPRWLRRKFEWGPSQWPMTWCFAVEQKGLDCGALAAFSREIFTSRGVKSYAVQLVQEYSQDTADHWTRKWTAHPASTHWIRDCLVYHEACAVEVAPSEIKVWDPSAGWWANPKQTDGYGSISAIRVVTGTLAESPNLSWGRNNIVANEWNVISRHDPVVVGQYDTSVAGGLNATLLSGRTPIEPIHALSYDGSEGRVALDEL